MHRRTFLQYVLALGAIHALPTWCRTTLAADRPALPIPNLLQADAAGKVLLRIQQGQTIFKGKPAKTFGYNSNLLGPALKFRQDQQVTIALQNGLQTPTTVHWHGLEIPGVADGGPQSIIGPGTTREVKFALKQQAATCWYHPHVHGQTGRQVAMGLAGLVIIEDSPSSALKLPNQWGKDDVPLVIQDKRFTATGEIDYRLEIMQAAVGWFGDTLLCNGVEYPRHTPPRGWLRLRLLNGCNARSLNLSTSDNRPFYVIASDGGLLPEPVKLMKLPMLSGERFEIMVDTSDGKAFDLVTLPVRQMGMTLSPFDRSCPVVRIEPLQQTATGTLPDALIPLPPLPSLTGLTTRSLQLQMDPRLDHQGMQELMRTYGSQAMAGMMMGGGGMQHGMQQGMNSEKSGMTGMSGMPMPAGEHNEQKPLDFHTGNRINGKAFDMNHPSFHVPLNRYERWTISSEGDMMLHPFHIHGTQFRILSENGKPPAAHRQGWKDMVWVEGSRSEVLVYFRHEAPATDTYMAHCHLLEHEDTGMMLGFTTG